MASMAVPARCLLAFAVHGPLLLAVKASASSEGALRLAEGSLSFLDYVRLFDREYEEGSQEYDMRRDLFEARAEAVRAHNARPDESWTAALNHLSDRTEAELKMRRGLVGATSGPAGGSAGVPQLPSALLQQDPEGAVLLAADEAPVHPPDELDWRHLSALQKIPDQGQCGSCWALAVASLLGAHHEIHRGTPRSFSVQELVSCTDNPKSCGGNGGCEGATMELALDYALQMGLSSEAEVPYTEETGTCPSSRKAGKSLATFLQKSAFQGSVDGGASFGMTSWRKLTANKQAPLMASLMQGPVGVSVAAKDWSMYGKGIFNGCGKDAVIDHAVTLVGYGTEGTRGTKFWTIRNSWGPRWGEGGHIRLLRHSTEDQHCGWDRHPELGTACKPYPEKERVCGMCGILFDSVSPHFEVATASS